MALAIQRDPDPGALGDLIAQAARIAYGQIEVSVWDGVAWLRPIFAYKRGQPMVPHRARPDELSQDPAIQRLALELANQHGITRGDIILEIQAGRCVFQKGKEAFSDGFREWLRGRFPELS